MIYINPDKKFIDEEADILVKVQIDNSLKLGWNEKDIMLVTNFEYEYRNVKSIVIGDDNYYEPKPTASKINAIITLFDKGLIEDDIYFFHDFDAFQLEDIKIELDKDKIALTDYGIVSLGNDYNRRWSTGVLFFGNGSRDIFQWIKDSVYKYQANEEVSLLVMTRHNDHDLLNRIDKLNITYNFATRRRNIDEQYKITDLPIKIIHFHPLDKRPIFYLHNGCNNMDVCVCGKNKTNKPLVTKTLITIFKQHGLVNINSCS